MSCQRKKKSRLTERLFDSSKNRYSVDRVRNFLDVQFGGNDTMNIKEKTIQTKEEILMYTAAMLYSKNREFPYDIQLSKEMITTKVADITNITITKK